MLLVVVLLCAVGSSYAVDVASCSNGTESLTFTAYNDGVVGRYLVELCTDLVPNATSWMLSLTFYDSENKCKNTLLGFHRPGKIHSRYEQKIVANVNCSHICLNTTFDLIFSSNYSIESAFLVDGNLRHLNHTCVTIENNYTIDDFKNNTAVVDILNQDEDNLTIVWHTGVPFLSYDMSICKIINVTSGLDEEECWKLSESQCSAPSSLEIRCALALLNACYRLVLALHATWGPGPLQDQGLVTHNFCKVPLAGPTVEGSDPAWVWAAAALAALAAAGVAARVAWSVLRRRTLHKAVLREWLVQRNESAAAAGGGRGARARRHVLLLYAREGAAAARLVAALRALLELEPAVQVYDIFSVEVMALAAGAPAEWVRGMLQRSDVTVLLLQTPALAALYHAPLQDHGTTVKLAEPLLGRRVVYRVPQYGDTLLQYAVRLTSEAAHAHGNYNKYYIATLSELPTEMFPQLVPYRRYLLPGAGALLARDVCGGPPGEVRGGAPCAAATGGALAALDAAAVEFTEHARHCPDYLMDELLLL